MVPLNWAINTDRKALMAGELAITAVLERMISAIDDGIADTGDSIDGVTGESGRERLYDSSCTILTKACLWWVLGSCMAKS